MESEVAPAAVMVGVDLKLEMSLEAAQVALQRVVQHSVLAQQPLEEAVGAEEEATVVVVEDVEGVDGEEDAVVVVGAEEEVVVVGTSPEEASMQRLSCVREWNNPLPVVRHRRWISRMLPPLTCRLIMARGPFRGVDFACTSRLCLVRTFAMTMWQIISMQLQNL